MKQFLLILSFLLISTLIFSQQGSVDESFGNKGFVASNQLSYNYALTQQPDGKILSAGGYTGPGSLVIRLLNNGLLDSSFGNDGYASFFNPASEAYDMLLLKDGKILVVGGLVDENGKSQSFLAKFKPDGKPDSSFGINGIAVIPKFHVFDAYAEIALNTDGSIIIGGAGVNNVNTLDSQYSVISRVSADGVFDNSFGNNGYVLNLTAINMKDLAIQADGKIVIAGYNFAGGFQQQDFVFSRYNSEGSLDNSFGNNGNVLIDGDGGEDVPEKIIIQADGKLVFGGYSSADKYYMSALRFNSDGSLDKTFGNAGKIFINFIDSAGKAYDMVQQQDGKFILAGAAYKYQGTSSDGSNFALCRISHDGQLDSSFGINGLQITNYPGSSSVAYCATLQSDNKIVLGGFYENTEGQSYLMVRYNNNISQKQILIAKIRRWLQHRNGIEWDGDNSINNYVVQRSYDGIHFSSITKISSGKNSNYTYQDPSPLTSNNYYRLQTTSINGAVNYSNVIAVMNDDAVTISPNPARNSLHVEGLSASAKTKLTIVDFTGTVKLQAVINTASYNLNIAALPPGNYLLKIELNGNVISKQFVKE